MLLEGKQTSGGGGGQSVAPLLLSAPPGLEWVDLGKAEERRDGGGQSVAPLFLSALLPHGVDVGRAVEWGEERGWGRASPWGLFTLPSPLSPQR